MSVDVARAAVAGLLVRRSIRAEASPAEVWRWLTEPARIGRWFADVDQPGKPLVAGRSFSFDFGDGDFFAGRVLEAEAPHHLEIEWRFFGLGPRYQIRFELTPESGGRATKVLVEDRGARSPAEQRSLEEGWEDFLGRLQRVVATHENCRYLWSEEISFGFLPRRDPAPSLADPDWWRRSFPTGSLGDADLEKLTAAGIGLSPSQRGRWQVELSLEPGSGLTSNLVIEQRDPTGELEGKVEGEVEDGAASVVAPYGYWVVKQSGFVQLPQATRVAERRRWAQDWRRAMAPFEESSAGAVA